MSSPETEKFEITDDDVYDSFNLRAGYRQTKNQATYGMQCLCYISVCLQFYSYPVQWL